MKILKSFWKWWRQLWQFNWELPDGIDPHKWESKIEIYRGLKE